MDVGSRFLDFIRILLKIAPVCIEQHEIDIVIHFMAPRRILTHKFSHAGSDFRTGSSAADDDVCHFFHKIFLLCFCENF